MRILIEFPYRTHWRTKERFKNDYSLYYPKDINEKEVKSAVILSFAPGQTFYILNFIFEIKDYFNFVDIWDLNKPEKNDKFARHNFIDFVLTPKTVVRNRSGIMLDHA